MRAKASSVAEKYKKTKLPSKKIEKGFLVNFKTKLVRAFCTGCRTLISERSAHPANRTLPRPANFPCRGVAKGWGKKGKRKKKRKKIAQREAHVLTHKLSRITRDTSLRGCTLDVRCAPHAALLALTARAKGKSERGGERNARKGHCAELIFCFWLT